MKDLITDEQPGDMRDQAPEKIGASVGQEGAPTAAVDERIIDEAPALSADASPAVEQLPTATEQASVATVDHPTDYEAVTYSVDAPVEVDAQKTSSRNPLKWLWKKRPKSARGLNASDVEPAGEDEEESSAPVCEGISSREIGPSATDETMAVGAVGVVAVAAATSTAVKEVIVEDADVAPISREVAVAGVETSAPVEDDSGAATAAVSVDDISVAVSEEVSMWPADRKKC